MLLVATFFLSFGRHIAILVVGRLLQGFSAAIVWTNGLALLADVFGSQRYGEAVGYTQTAVSVGTTSAPLLGGVVYAQGGYSAVSTMSIVTVAISVAFALIMVEPETKTGWEDPAPSTSGFPNNHHIAASQDASSIASDPNSLPNGKPSTRQVDERSRLIPKDGSERKTPSRPAYSLLLGSKRVLAAMWGIFTFSFVIVSFEAMIPLFVKETFHWNSTRAALIFLSWIIPGFFGPVAGKAWDRWKSPWIPVIGFLSAVPPLIMMRFVTNDSTLHKILLCGLLTLVGKYP